MCPPTAAPHTLNLTPHPAPVAPLASQSGQEGRMGEWFYVAKWRIFVIRRGYNVDLPASSKFTLTAALTEWFNFSAA